MSAFPEINLSALFGGPGAQAQATAAPRAGKIGVDYVPNMNADLRIVVPFQNDAAHAAQLSSSGLDPNASLPAEFSWHDQSSVRKSGRMRDYNSSWLMKPPNQAHCGSCWAVSSTSALTDRFSIAEKRKVPDLAATVTASCATHTSGGNGCSGGFPSDAGCFFENVGVPPDSCWPYASWCSPTAASCTPPTCCYAGGGSGPGPRPWLAGATAQDVKGQRVVGCPDYAKRLGVPGCDGTQSAPGNPRRCANGGAPDKVYRAVAASTRSLGAGSAEECFHRMKWNLYAGGPIVAGYNVFTDFMLPSIPSWGWNATNGVYIHAADSPYAHDPFILGIPAKLKAGTALRPDEQKVVNMLGLTPDDTPAAVTGKANAKLGVQVGAHAVAAVGWGTADTKNPKYGKVNYWWVRNSWGGDWNEKGYFRIAFTDTAKGVNVACGFDYPQVFKSSGGALSGGATVFQASDTYHPPTPSNKQSGGDSTRRRNMVIIMGVVGALLLVLIVWAIAASGRTHKSRGGGRR